MEAIHPQVQQRSPSLGRVEDTQMGVIGSYVRKIRRHCPDIPQLTAAQTLPKFLPGRQENGPHPLHKQTTLLRGQFQHPVRFPLAHSQRFFTQNGFIGL